MNFPVIEDDKRIIVVGWGDDLHKSAEQATENAIALFSRKFPFTFWPKEDVYKLISAEGNLEICNGSGSVKTCGLTFWEKRLLNKYHFAIF